MAGSTRLVWSNSSRDFMAEDIKPKEEKKTVAKSKTSKAKVTGILAPGVVSIDLGGKEATASYPVNGSRPEEGSEIEVEEHERHGFIQRR